MNNSKDSTNHNEPFKMLQPIRMSLIKDTANHNEQFKWFSQSK